MSTIIYTQTLESCCGVEDICHISDCKDAKQVILELCAEHGGVTYDPYRTYDARMVPRKTLRDLPGVFIFTGVVGFVKPPKFRTATKTGYGEKLAAFIRKNKLGKVVAGAQGPNRKNHPNHICQAWVWSPDPKALEKWWQKNLKDYKANEGTAW